jgi:heptosyltransferase-2
MKKVLIIKLGYSETLDNRLSLTTSLGDVLRATVILHFFKKCQVSWLVDCKARPLLENNKYIDKLYDYIPEEVEKIRKQKFDIIINLEKLPQICSLADSIPAKKYYGFVADRLNGFSVSPLTSTKMAEISLDPDKKRKNEDFWQKIVLEALGKKWHKEKYILGYKPKSKIKYDIGFNWTVGSKWTNKAWPKSSWEELEGLIKDRYSISWQKGLNSLYEYIDWINSCRLIVTADTLGLHICFALRKRVVALFGPTAYREIYFYNCGSILLPEAPYNCVPCLKPYCDKKRQCLEFIAPERVEKIIKNEFKRNKITAKV